jgi:FkbM family methyltransferase
VFDVGASIGKYACRFSKLVGPHGQVHCFEPLETSFSCLAQMKGILRLDNTRLHKLALSDHSGQQTLYTPVMAHGIEIQTRSSLDRDLITFDNARLLEETVQTSTIDEVVDQLELTRLDYVKCDTESSKLKILDGGLETLRRYKPILPARDKS